MCLRVCDWTSLPLSACFDVTGKENGLFDSDFLTHQHSYCFNSRSFKHVPVHLNTLFYLMWRFYLVVFNTDLYLLPLFSYKCRSVAKNNFPETDSKLRMKKAMEYILIPFLSSSCENVWVLNMLCLTSRYSSAVCLSPDSWLLWVVLCFIVSGVTVVI